MKKLVSILMLIVLVATLVGCSCTTSTDDSLNTTNTTSSEAFGNNNPAMPVVTYRDEEEKIIENAIVPAEYEQPPTYQGKLQYEDYNTIDYEDDNHPMGKYLVVYTPYGYDPNKEYDIMYLTHGHTGGATTWLGSPTDPYEMKNVLDHLIQDGKVRPMLVVSMTYYDDNKDEETDDYDSHILNAFGKELRNDIIPMVESKYNTYAKSTSVEDLKASRNHRIMGGFSMGGVTTFLQMCESMDYFKYYMPVSGTLYWSTTIDRRSGDAGKKLVDSITAQGYGRDDFFVYMSTGTIDFAKSTMDKQFQSMKKQSNMFTFGQPGEEGVNCAYGLGQNEGHNAHGRETATYNALPVLSALIAREQ